MVAAVAVALLLLLWLLFFQLQSFLCVWLQLLLLHGCVTFFRGCSCCFRHCSHYCWGVVVTFAVVVIAGFSIVVAFSVVLRSLFLQCCNGCFM